MKLKDDNTLTRQLKVLRKGGKNFREVFRIATQVRKNMEREKENEAT